jgi:WXG100 family type VII secretion target
MAGEKIRLVYELAEDMAKSFQKGAQVLESTTNEMQGIASTLEGGALLGRGGTAFVEAIKTQLYPGLKRLQEKFRELDGDVKAAIKAMRDEDAKAASGFKG